MKIGLFALICSMLFFLVGYTYINEVMDKDIIYDGIYIDEIDVGGFTKEEAYSKIDEYIESKRNATLLLRFEDHVEEIPLYELGFDAVNKDVIEEAFDYGKEGNVIKRYKAIKDLKKEPLELDLEFECDESILESYLDSIKNNFAIEPKNAIIQRINHQFVIEPEQVGYELDMVSTKENILTLINIHQQEELSLEVALMEKEPEYTSAYYENIKDVIGSFYTEFNASNTLRTENLKVGSGKINGALLHPGEEYSTYDAIAPINEANGYKDAPIIVNGMIEDGIGGGICQIATTLYNALLYSELEILERRNHSMPVSYIEKGKDAALLRNILDLKFKNSTAYPIYIESYIEGNRLYFKIYGLEERDPNRRLEFESVIIETITPPPANITYDSTMLEGKREVIQKEIPGYKVKLYKHIYLNDVLQEKVLINYSDYRATPAVIKVGTKAPKKEVFTEVLPEPEIINEIENLDEIEEVLEIDEELLGEVLTNDEDIEYTE